MPKTTPEEEVVRWLVSRQPWLLGLPKELQRLNNLVAQRGDQIKELSQRISDLEEQIAELKQDE